MMKKIPGYLGLALALVLASSCGSSDNSVNGKDVSESAGAGTSGTGAGTGTGTGASDAFPSVIASTPADKAEGVELTTPITVTFSEPMDPSSVNEDTVGLFFSDRKTKAAVTYAGNVATITPAVPLALLTPYTIVLKPDIQDPAGRHLYETRIAFTSREGVWSDPKQLSKNTGSVHVLSPEVTVNAETGDVFYTWFQSTDQIHGVVWGGAYDPDGGPSADAVFLQQGSKNADSSVSLVADSKGNAFAAWAQYDATISNLGNGWWNFYDGSSGAWKTAQLLESETGDVRDPKLAVNAADDVFAVWSQREGQEYMILGRKYSNGLWDVPTLINKGGYGAQQQSIGVDAKGGAVVIYKQAEVGVTNLWANVYDPSTGWNPNKAVMIENAPGNIFSPRVVVNAAGDAIAVWGQETDTNGDNKVDDKDYASLFMSRYSSDTGTWSAPVLLETDNSGPAEYPEAAFDRDGNAFTVWRQKVGGRYSAYYSYYNAETAKWSPASLLETDDAGDVNVYVHVAFDGAGNAMASWAQIVSVASGNNEYVYTARYVKTTHQWSAPAALPHADADTAYTPEMAMDRMGRATAVWFQLDGNTTFHAWISRFQ